jgi:hypothetical protein
MVFAKGAYSTRYVFVPSFESGYQCKTDYHWLQLWKAIIGLIDFLGVKLDELSSITGVEQLLQEVCCTLWSPIRWRQFSAQRSSRAQSLVLLDIVSIKAEAFLSSPEAIHEFIVSFCVTEARQGLADMRSMNLLGPPPLFRG